MNVKMLLKKSILELKNSGIETAEIDARVLLEHAVNKDSAFIFSHPEYLLTNAQYSRFRHYIRRRKRGEPVAYITGRKEFYGLDFLVNKYVLIPRPESEWLVGQGIKYLKKLIKCEPKIMAVLGYTQAQRYFNRRLKRKIEQIKELNILDMGTGSGCIAISLSKELSAQYSMLNTVKIYAADFNKRGLLIAKKNARNLEAKNVHFYFSNLFSNRRIKNKIFDLAIANLPYVPQNFRNSEFGIRSSIAFEPQDAIFADDNGTAIIKRFLKEARSHLSPTGLILLELDPRNAKALLSFAKRCYPNAKIELKKDLARKNRYLSIKN